MTPGRFDWICKCLAMERLTVRERKFLNICKERVKSRGAMPEDMEEILEDIHRRKIEMRDEPVPWKTP